MSINPSEVTKLLKDQIKNFGEKAEVSEIGKILSVGDGTPEFMGLTMYKLEKWSNLMMVQKGWL